MNTSRSKKSKSLEREVNKILKTLTLIYNSFKFLFYIVLSYKNHCYLFQFLYYYLLQIFSKQQDFRGNKHLSYDLDKVHKLPIGL